MNKIITAPICEIFTSIQGEFYSLGVPSIFIRFWGCNLRCRFNDKYCDTPYSVVTGYNKSKLYTPEELFDKIKKILEDKPNIKNIVITGGEALLYQKFLKSFFSLIKFINISNKIIKNDNNITIEIETNGTIIVENEIANYVDRFNISPKLKNSNQEHSVFDKLRINYNALNSFPKQKSIFKFVIDNENDIIEVKQIEEKCSNIPVYLMPEGISRIQINDKGRQIVELCVKYGYKYCPREHINLWSKKRGV
jgi:7-carboxy-7-deazaguanine synthase